MTGLRTSTWMPLYIGDYLADTMHLTTGEHGAYLLLIFAYWRQGSPLVDDDHELASICRMQPKEWKRIRDRIGRFFQIKDGFWTHGRIEQELSRSQEIRSERSKAGAIGAAKRWQTHGNDIANAMANERQTDANHSHSHISSLRSDIPPVGPPDGKSKRATRLDAAWEPSPEDRAFAEQLGLQADAIWPEYRDFWIARPGKDGTKLDWPATWRNHCRRLAERAQGQQRQPNRQGPPSDLAAARRAAARFTS